MAAEVLFGGVKARLPVLRAYNFFNHSRRTQTLGRMDSCWRQQRNYLFHRTKDLAVGFYSGKFVLHRALCRQPQSMAQG